MKTKQKRMLGMERCFKGVVRCGTEQVLHLMKNWEPVR